MATEAKLVRIYGVETLKVMPRVWCPLSLADGFSLRAARGSARAERAASAWDAATTDFLPPPELAACAAALAPLADVGAAAVAGRAGAERVRLVVGHEDVIAGLLAEVEDLEEDVEGGGGGGRLRGIPAVSPESAGDFVSVVALSGNFSFVEATQRHFLGAVLKGGGVERRFVGDVVVAPPPEGKSSARRGSRVACFVVCDPVVAESLLAAPPTVLGVPTAAELLPYADALEAVPPPPPGEKLNVSVAQARLDSVVSAVFRLSRSAAADAIKRGEVSLNWVPTARAAAAVRAGDVLSVRGKGRAQVLTSRDSRKGVALTIERRGAL